MEKLRQNQINFLPILVVMGDMPFLNKLVGLKSGVNAAHQCWICNIHEGFLTIHTRNLLIQMPELLHRKQSYIQKALKKLDIMQSRATYSIS